MIFIIQPFKPESTANVTWGGEGEKEGHWGEGWVGGEGRGGGEDNKEEEEEENDE